MCIVACNERIQGTEELQWVYIIVDRVCLHFRRLVLELREENVQDQEENQIQMKGMGGEKKPTAHSVTKRGSKGKKKTVEVGKDSEQKPRRDGRDSGGRRGRKKGRSQVAVGFLVRKSDHTYHQQ